MSTPRTIITGVCFLLLVAVSVAAAVQTIYSGLPETPPSNTTVLLQQLAERDIADEPHNTKLKIAGRVQRDLRDDVDWPTELEALSPSQRTQLVENIAELAKEAFVAKVDIYSHMPDEHRRKRYLDRQIDEILSWARIVDRAFKPSDQALVGAAALPALLSRVNGWYRDATPEDIERLQKFQQALRDQLVERFKRGMRPGEG